MAKKTFAFFGILAVLLLSLGITSAATNQENVTLSLNQTSIFNASVGNTYTIEANVENLNTENIYVEFRNTNWDSWDSAATVSNISNSTFVGIFTIPSGGPASRGAYVDVYNESNHSQLLFTLDESISISYYSAPTPAEESICEIDYSGEAGDWEIKKIGVENTGKGTDEKWQYLDKINVEVDVKNTWNDDIQDVEVQMIIFKDGEDVTSDFDFNDDVIDSINRLKDGDTETVTFEIEVPTDVESGDYEIYLVAYSNGAEDEFCVSTSDDNDFTDDMYYEFKVESVDYEDAVAVDSDKLGAYVDTFCGQENFELSIPVYNLNDEREDKVLVTIYNSELGINDYYVMDRLNDGDTDYATFYINVPQDLKKDKYDLDIVTYYSWDEDEDEDDIASYDENNDATLRLNIVGCKAASPSMNSQLASSMEVGKELIVKTIVKNNADSQNIIFSASGYESWAKLVSVSPESGYVNKDESTEVTVTLIPFEEGQHDFILSSVIGDDTFNLPIVANVKSNDLLGLGLSGFPLYLVMAIAILLVLIFIVLLVKVLKPARKA